MTEIQEIKYKAIKQKKRAKSLGIEEEKEEVSFRERLFKLLLEKKLTKDGLIQSCIIQGEKYTNVVGQLNLLLKNRGHAETTKDFFRTEKIRTQKDRSAINSLVPSV